jgi:predicted Fe-Mo cluster-binding NifX family protein
MSKKIAITVQRKDGLGSPIDPRFGRASAFVIVDRDTRELVLELDNVFAEHAHGAGTGAASLMEKQDVGVVVSGRFGPKAEQALTFLEIEMWTAPEGITVKETLDRLAAGKLERWNASTPPGGDSGGGGRGRGGGGGGGGRGRGPGGGGGGGRGRGRGGGGGRRR